MNNKIVLLVVILITLGVTFIFLFGQESFDYEKEETEELYNQTINIEEEQIYSRRSAFEVMEENNKEKEEKEGLLYDESMEGFVSCLIDEGMVVYSLSTCPACSSFANQFGGYSEVEELFVECLEERELCQRNMKTGRVPEIQINKELYTGSRSLEALSEETNCKINI